MISSKAGEYSKGTLLFLWELFQDEKHSLGQSKVDPEHFKEELWRKEALYLLAMRHGLEQSAYFNDFLALEKKSRRGKAAFAYWRKKIKPDFAFSDVFRHYRVQVDPQEAVREILRFRELGGKEEEVLIGAYRGGAITLRDLQRAQTTAEYKTFIGLDAKPMAEALSEKVRLFLACVAHDEMLRNYGAYESELVRFDMANVADKYLRVKYGFAQKGIYPEEPFKLNISIEEIYDEFHRHQNYYTGLDYVEGYEYAFKDEGEAKAMARQGMFEERRGRFLKIFAYQDPQDEQERRRRTLREQVILEAAYKNKKVSKTYPCGKEICIFVANRFSVREKADINKYYDNIEYNLRIDLLREQFTIDLKDMQDYLNFKAKMDFLG